MCTCSLLVACFCLKFAAICLPSFGVRAGHGFCFCFGWARAAVHESDINKGVSGLFTCCQRVFTTSRTGAQPSSRAKDTKALLCGNIPVRVVRVKFSKQQTASYRTCRRLCVGACERIEHHHCRILLLSQVATRLSLGAPWQG